MWAFIFSNLFLSIQTHFKTSLNWVLKPIILLQHTKKWVTRNQVKSGRVRRYLPDLLTCECYQVCWNHLNTEVPIYWLCFIGWSFLMMSKSSQFPYPFLLHQIDRIYSTFLREQAEKADIPAELGFYLNFRWYGWAPVIAPENLPFWAFILYFSLAYFSKDFLDLYLLIVSLPAIEGKFYGNMGSSEMGEMEKCETKRPPICHMVWEKEFSYIVGRSLKWYSHLAKRSGGFL